MWKLGYIMLTGIHIMYVCHFCDIILVNELNRPLLHIVETSVYAVKALIHISFKSVSLMLHPPLFQNNMVQTDKHAKYNLNKMFE